MPTAAKKVEKKKMLRGYPEETIKKLRKEGADICFKNCH